MKQSNFYLSEKQIEKLKALSSETDISVSEHIRRAIDLYLESKTDNQKKS